MSLLLSRLTLTSLLVCGMARVGATPACFAQNTSTKTATVPVVMLSDIHFDPFHDPAKFNRLRAAPAAGWQKILAEPDAPTQAADSAKLMTECKTRGVDTPWTLLQSSLAAAHAQSPHALFVTVSGDLLAHAFDCKFRALGGGGATGPKYDEFAAKTVAYVASELHRTFGATPVYLALGNNDSGCGDYRESPDSNFLKSVGESFGEDLNSAAGSKDLLNVFPDNGDYSVALPAPVVRGRLIVLQDLFLSKAYTGCDGKADQAAGAKQLDWLHKELAASHERHEQVWVMAHIPPGVDVYSTTSHNINVCAWQAPEMFLHDEKLVDVLTDFAPDIRLAIFAHTHNDEMRLLQASPAEGEDANAEPAWVAAKLVPSITPINGNYPAFTLADVDPTTATMTDYRVIEANSKTGVGAKWTEEYRYSKTYHQKAFGPEEVSKILSGFIADKQGATAESGAYMQNFMVNGGLRALAIRLVWPQYACSLQNNTAVGYRACACAAAPAPAAQ